MRTFLGIDLGWYGKPTGLAAFALDGTDVLRLRSLTRLADTDAIFAWVEEHAAADCVAAVDAPLVIRNAAGIRPAERDLNRDWRRYDAGCHAANLGLPFAERVTAFSRRLESLGFRHACAPEAAGAPRQQLEVHPHAATVGLFGLDRIVKYKRGLRAGRASELQRLRDLLLQHLPTLDPRTVDLKLPAVPATGDLKPVEDQFDAVLCAYMAAHWWRWGITRNTVYGDAESGYIVTPRPAAVQ